jgi:hypothetical protein
LRYVIPKLWSNRIFPYQIAGAVILFYHYTIIPVYIGLKPSRLYKRTSPVQIAEAFIPLYNYTCVNRPLESQILIDGNCMQKIVRGRRIIQSQTLLEDAFAV